MKPLLTLRGFTNRLVKTVEEGFTRPRVVLVGRSLRGGSRPGSRTDKRLESGTRVTVEERTTPEEGRGPLDYGNGV